MKTNRALYLISQKKYCELASLLNYMSAPEISKLFSVADMPDRAVIFRLLKKALAEEVLFLLDKKTWQSTLEFICSSEISAANDLLEETGVYDQLDELPSDAVVSIIRHAKDSDREKINTFLSYSEQSAGSIMSSEFISIKNGTSAHEAIALLGQNANLQKAVCSIFVTDNDLRLIGTVDLRFLMLSDMPSDSKSIIFTSTVSAYTCDDRETVAQLISKYGLLSLPVIDAENRLVGVVTADRALEVLSEEATEDIEKMVAIVPSERPYFETGVIKTWLSRIPWLLFLMISATFTGSIIRHFEAALGSLIILTAFIPMIMGSGGNAGAQTSVTIIRSLSLGEISPNDFFRIMWKEFLVSFLCGLSLCIVAFAKLTVIDKTGVDIALTVSLSLFATVILAKLTGASLPLFAKLLHLDPAVMANPFITTVVDALSLLIYFSIATQFLNF